MNLARLAIAPVIAIAMLVAAPAHAVPALQLDIAGGTYDATTETVFASSNTFSLYAYYTGTAPTSTFYLSMALVPPTSVAGNYGSFKINGSTVNVTGDMVYGTPPIETYLAFDPGDLSKHSIFPTYFAEQSFTFSGPNSGQSGVYNTQDHAGWGPQAGTGMYYKKFDLDVSGLSAGEGIHFDFYNEALVTYCSKKSGVCSSTDVDVNQFAPFSHDAQGMVSSVPEPETYAMLLAGLGLMGFVARRRKTAAGLI